MLTVLPKNVTRNPQWPMLPVAWVEHRGDLIRVEYPR